MSVPGGRRITSVPRAGFVPVPPDIDVEALVHQSENFATLPRIDAQQLGAGDEMLAQLDRLIQERVIVQGVPLVIENWHLRSDWPRWIFSPEWLRDNHGCEEITTRDLREQKDISMSYGHYLANLPKLASKFSPDNYDTTQQRLYAKDLDIPLVWRSALSSFIPPSTFYLHPKADLMSSLPESARAENMMCYIGHEGTYTPAHKEMCASLGQNIMVHTSSGADKEPGSSIWFMTCSADRDIIAEYWLGHLGHDIEVEAHFASVEALMDAPFKVFIHEQKLGDYILVPPLAPHQVWNRGETTIKAAWNRTTVDTLELAVAESLPKARLVCRDEQYKNRAIIHTTLQKYTRILEGVDEIGDLDAEKLKSDFCRLFKLFNQLMLDECFSPELAVPPVERIDNEFNVSCSFCRGNIWNRFLSCKNCIVELADGEDDCYDICMDCYSRGRSCYCVSKLDWVEQHDWKQLKEEHEDFRTLVLAIQGTIDEDSPLPLDQGLEKLGRKSLARVCQEQLEVRPFVDIRKNGLEDEEDETRSAESKKKSGAFPNCHVCKVRHDKWKCATCDTCDRSYCFGNLWRAFDMDPFSDILCQYQWQCPTCRGICSCGACRKRDDMTPYAPKGTYLGASTKHVADERSIESLVDFARGNLGWVKDLDPETSAQRRRESIAVDTDPNILLESSTTIPIDPALGGGDEEGRSPSAAAVPDEKHSNRRADSQVTPSTPVNAAETPGTSGNGRRRGNVSDHNVSEKQNTINTTALPPPDSELSTLEQNPLAFIAAAGLQALSAPAPRSRPLPRRPRPKVLHLFPAPPAVAPDWSRKTKVRHKPIRKKTRRVVLRFGAALEAYRGLVERLVRDDRVVSDLGGVAVKVVYPEEEEEEEEEVGMEEVVVPRVERRRRESRYLRQRREEGEDGEMRKESGGGMEEGETMDVGEETATIEETATVEETAEARAAREAAAAETQRLEEAERAETQRQQEAESQRLAEATRLQHEASAKKRLEEESAARLLHHQERRDRKRKEADRNAKLVAAGVLSWSDVESESESESESEASPRLLPLDYPPPLDSRPDFPPPDSPLLPPDSPLLLPAHTPPFAIVIPPPSASPHWRNEYVRPPRLVAPGRKKRVHGDGSFRVRMGVEERGRGRGRREERRVRRVGVGGYAEEEEEMGKEGERRRIMVKRVLLKPGKWGVVEISDDEGGQEEDGYEGEGVEGLGRYREYEEEDDGYEGDGIMAVRKVKVKVKMGFRGKEGRRDVEMADAEDGGGEGDEFEKRWRRSGDWW